MQNDLTDAVKWAVAEGIADPDRVAIFGLSYGGYAALAGAAFTPDLYKCAIDLCGPSNLATCIKSFAPYFNMRAVWNSRVGNPDDPADRELLAGASPLFAADKIRIPMLIGQGANDARVIQAESEQIVAAINKNGGTPSLACPPRRCPHTDKIRGANLSQQLPRVIKSARPSTPSASAP
jgi:dipeptidyl aminopeptidase/acylaminoacyl peptidase